MESHDEVGAPPHSAFDVPPADHLDIVRQQLLADGCVEVLDVSDEQLSQMIDSLGSFNDLFPDMQQDTAAAATHAETSEESGVAATAEHTEFTQDYRAAASVNHLVGTAGADTIAFGDEDDGVDANNDDFLFAKNTVSASLLFENEESFDSIIEESAIAPVNDVSPIQFTKNESSAVEAAVHSHPTASSKRLSFFENNAAINANSSRTSSSLNSSFRSAGKLGGGARRVIVPTRGADDQDAPTEEVLDGDAANIPAPTFSGDTHTPLPHPHSLGRTSYDPMKTPEDAGAGGARLRMHAPSHSPNMDKIVKVAGFSPGQSRQRLVHGQALRYSLDEGDIYEIADDDKVSVGAYEGDTLSDGDASHMQRPLYHASPPCKNRSFLCAPSFVLTEEKKKKRTYIIKHKPHTFKKTDPVARFHAMNRTWRKDKFLRNSARRAKSKTGVATMAPSPSASPAPKRAVGSSRKPYSHVSKQRPIRVNNYVPPTEKKRSKLRWDIRASMMNTP